MAKNIAKEYINNFFKSKEIATNSVSLSKLHQSNKNHAFLVQADFDSFSFTGYVYQNNKKEWTVNITDNFAQTGITNKEFDEYKSRMERAKFSAAQFRAKIARAVEIRKNRDEQPSRQDLEKQRKLKRG